MALHLASPSPAPSIVLTSPDRWLRRELPTVRSRTDGLFPRRRDVRACVIRRSADYKPSLWHDKYIQSLISVDVTETDMKRLDELKEQVVLMINEETMVVDKLELIDALQQLGVAYHFEKEIKHALDSIFRKLDDICMEMKENLYVIALLFRLLRGHGYRVSQDIFYQFKDEKGSFKSNLDDQIKNLWSLYEASYLAVEGEDTLVEAQNFTIQYLNDFLSNLSDDNHKLRDYVARALDQPLQWRMKRLHTRWFIDAYEKEEKMRPFLLEFAKLDFNMVQNMYKRELKDVSSWWSNMELWKKLPFSRNRLTENYLWCVDWAFEPKYLMFRLAQTKANCLTAAIDDIYDDYGSLDELKLFTEVVDRWDAFDIEQLPEYMRVCFLALFNTTNDIAYVIMKEKGLNILPFLKRADYPEIVRLSSIILRLYNDLGTFKSEHQRGQVANSINCYMHHEGATETAARERIKELINDYRKKLNGACLADSSFNEYFTAIALNLPRAGHFFYVNGDGYGSPERETKNAIISLLIETVKI